MAVATTQVATGRRNHSGITFPCRTRGTTPTRVPQRWPHDVSVVVAAATGSRSRSGSGRCLMLFIVEFAPTPRTVSGGGSGSGSVPHGPSTVSPVPRWGQTSRPGRGSGARGTFHDGVVAAITPT